MRAITVERCDVPPPGSPSQLSFVDGWNEHPDGSALISDRGTLTYGELGARVAATMEALGSRRRLVLIEMSNTVSAIVGYLAALRAGHVVLIASDGGARESLVRTYDPDVVAGPDAGGVWQVTERRAGTRHDLHPELALLLSTSGSTGSPKLVRLSYENLDGNAQSIAEYLDIDHTDRAMTSLPLSYCYGLSVLHSHLTKGAAVIVTGLSVVDDAFWDLARAARATSFAGVPYTFELLDRVGFADIELPSLRYVTQAGGKLGADGVRRFGQLGRRRGWDLVVMYGATEATARMAYLPVDRVLDAPESIGIPIPNGRFVIDDDGELIYHGPNVMLGYARTPGDFALGRTVDRLRTGDLARRGPDGLYEIVGRRSRFLKLFGLRVDLDQLEQGLRSDGIQALCTGDDTGLVIAVADGTPDPTAGVCAKVGLPTAAVRILVLDELPRNANGKPDYAAIRRSADLPRDRVESVGVRAVYRDVFKTDQVGDADTFVSLGGDSLSFIETSQRLERQLGALPSDWHLLSVAELEAGTGGRLRGPLRWMETSIVLRAVAIVLVCADHVGLSQLEGAGHVLLASAGYSFARFQLNAVTSTGQVRPLIRSIARIAVPSVIVIAIAYLLTRQYDVWNVLLIENLVGPDDWDVGADRWDPRLNYWFIEVLVVCLVFCAALLSIPAVRKLQRAQPFWVAYAVLGVCLVLRFHVFTEYVPLEPYRAQTTAWLFAIGWAAACARQSGQRLLVTAAAVCGVMLPGFLDGEPSRKFVVAGGLLLLIWLTRLPVPVGLQRLTELLASASLWIYLTQPLTFYAIAWAQSLLNETAAAESLGASTGADDAGLLHEVRLAIATIVAVTGGVLAWQIYRRALRGLSLLSRRQLHAREN